MAVYASSICSSKASDPETRASMILCRCSCCSPLAANAQIPIHNGQLLDWRTACRFAAPPNRQSSRSVASRASGVLRSVSDSVGTTASIVTSISLSIPCRTMAARTSVWNSAWLRHALPMTEALVSRIPLCSSNRSKTFLKVTDSAPRPRPSARRIEIPVSSRRSRISSLLRRARFTGVTLGTPGPSAGGGVGAPAP